MLEWDNYRNVDRKMHFQKTLNFDSHTATFRYRLQNEPQRTLRSGCTEHTSECSKSMWNTLSSPCDRLHLPAQTDEYAWKICSKCRRGKPKEKNQRNKLQLPNCVKRNEHHLIWNSLPPLSDPSAWSTVDIACARRRASFNLRSGSRCDNAIQTSTCWPHSEI